MRYSLIVLLLNLALTACSGSVAAPAVTSDPNAIASPTSFVFPSEASEASQASGANAQPSPSGQLVSPTETTLPTETQATALGPQLIILSPQENATVNTAQITLTGQAIPGTVITFNEEIIIVGSSGEFTVTVPLDEGPNAIEIVASDPDGTETTAEWIVTYDPEQ